MGAGSAPVPRSRHGASASTVGPLSPVSRLLLRRPSEPVTSKQHLHIAAGLRSAAIRQAGNGNRLAPARYLNPGERMKNDPTHTFVMIVAGLLTACIITTWISGAWSHWISVGFAI